MKEGECMYLAKVIKSDNRMYVYDALNNKLATINSKEDLLENESYENFLKMLQEQNQTDIQKQHIEIWIYITMKWEEK